MLSRVSVGRPQVFVTGHVAKYPDLEVCSFQFRPTVQPVPPLRFILLYMKLSADIPEGGTRPAVLCRHFGAHPSAKDLGLSKE